MEETRMLIEAKADPLLIETQLREINTKIAQMNHDAPSLTLHRKKVTRDNLKSQLERWV